MLFQPFTEDDIFVVFEIGGTGIKTGILSKKHLDQYDMHRNQKALNNPELCHIRHFKTNEKPPKELIEYICTEILKSVNSSSQIISVGVSSFGPVGLRKERDDYGFILSSPKKAWTNFDLVGNISLALNVTKDKISIETDVNAPALLEYNYGKYCRNKSIDSLAYITIGTGCGIGLVVNNQLVHGLLHPEGGHIRIKKREDDNFRGVCCYHNDCAEGLINNISIMERLKLNSVDEIALLEDDHEIWDLIGNYVAQVCLNLLYVVSVEKIIIGGGIINRNGLLDKIKTNFLKENNKYIVTDESTEKSINDYIIRSNFKNDCGLLSSIALAITNIK